MRLHSFSQHVTTFWLVHCLAIHTQSALAFYKNLTLAQFVVIQNGIENGDDPHVMIDIRTKREYEYSHISGSYLIENLASFATAAEKGKPSDLAGCEYCPLIVYDSSGSRSRVALEYLRNAGFINLFHYPGGMNEWAEKNMPSDSGKGEKKPDCTKSADKQTECLVWWEAQGPTASPTDPPPTASPTSSPPSLEPSTSPPSAAPTTVPTLPLPTVSPTFYPTFAPLDTPLPLDADAFLRLRNMGRFDLILDIREDADLNGHIFGATLIGPLTPENAGTKLAPYASCHLCTVAVYGNDDVAGIANTTTDDTSPTAVALEELQRNGFTSRLYRGPSVDEWVAAQNLIVYSPSAVPPCQTSEAGKLFECQQEYNMYVGMPVVAPTDAPTAEPAPPVPTATSPPTPDFAVAGIQGSSARRQGMATVTTMILTAGMFCWWTVV